MSDLLARLRATYQAMTPRADGFYPPDASPNHTPYACSYHWFRGPDGRVISLDVIRSDDTGSFGLRVIRERADGGVDGLSYAAEQKEWQPLRRDGRLDDGEAGTRPILSRSQEGVAGCYFDRTGTSASAWRKVRFALTISPQSPGYGTGQLGLGVSYLVASDFSLVRYRGSISFDGEHLQIDSIGALSLHAGDKLPQYAYFVTVPPLDGTEEPSLIGAAIHGDSLRIGEAILSDRILCYAYGRNGLPPVSLHVGEFGHDIPIGLNGRLELRELRSFHHALLGEPACTTAAHARYLPAQGAPIDLGRIFLDYRGRYFLQFLEAAGTSRNETERGS